MVPCLATCSPAALSRMVSPITSWKVGPAQLGFWPHVFFANPTLHTSSTPQQEQTPFFLRLFLQTLAVPRGKLNKLFLCSQSCSRDQEWYIIQLHPLNFLVGSRRIDVISAQLAYQKTRIIIILRLKEYTGCLTTLSLFWEHLITCVSMRIIWNMSSRPVGTALMPLGSESSIF